MAAQDELEVLLKQHGMVLLRCKRHQVWGHPDGRAFTFASTPSDFRAYRNILTDLRRFLNEKRVINKNPDRKPKKGCAPPAPFAALKPIEGESKPTWQEKLALVRPVLAHPQCVKKAEQPKTELKPVIKARCISSNLMRDAFKKAGLV